MLLPNILSGVEVCIQAVPTFAAEEKTLRTTIGAMLIATLRAGLTGMPGIDLDHGNTSLLPFISDEVIQLGKRPTMQLSLVINILVVLAPSHLGIVSNVLEVFQDNHRAWGSVLDDTLGEDMIAIPVEASLLPRQLPQMSLRRLRSVGLQFSLEAERAAIDFFPVPITEELPLAGDSRAVQAQVNSDDLIAFRNKRIRDLYHDMQPPFAFTVTQISSTGLAAIILFAISGNRKGDALLASHSREANGVLLPVESIGVQVIADRTGDTLGHLYRLELRHWLASLQGFGYLLRVARLMFGLPGKSGFQGLSSLDPCLDNLIRYQPRTRFLDSAIHRMMQANAILLMLLPAICTHGIERFGKLSKRFLQGYCLLWRGMQLYAYRSIHANVVPYMSTFLQV